MTGLADMVGRPLIYVAGPYTHPDPVANTRDALIAADALIDGGYVPLVPHLSLAWHLVTPRPVEHWYAYDIALLARCDGVLRITGASTGADAEVAWAKAHGKPVAYNRKQLDRYWRQA